GAVSSVRVCGMARRPPLCSLFPYTTLFRSAQDAEVHDPVTAGAGRRLRERARRALVGGLVAGARCLLQDADQVHDRGAAARGAVDRKSTRLNSSHVKISYAVFCLKKKNTHA